MLQLRDLSVRIAGRLLIEQADLALPTGTRAGLVGRNGSGKTTLFKVITKDHGSESGSIEMTKGWRVGQVAQEAPGTEDNLISIVLAADEERAALLAEAENASDPMRIAEIQMRLVDIRAHSAEARAASILSGLGFSEEKQHQPASSFSGGWRMRVALAAVLFSEPDLLLLDEPTNYLDLEGTLWLENYLARYPGTFLIISHDRDLLNKAVSSIIHLENRKLTFYRGSYDSFERQRAEQRELDAKSRAKLEDQTKHMQAFVDRFRYKASKARQAQSRIKAIEKLKPPELLEEAGTTPIRFPNPERISASPMIKLEHVSCGYAANEPVLDHVSLNIDADDRIALLGANGNGKSTFAKLLSQRLEHVTGTIVRASKISVGMFAQHQMDDLHENESAVDHVRALMKGAPEGKVRARVAQMGLDRERMNTAAKDLSGGEKARLLLGLASFNAPDLLILDEPTNHLDVGAREALVHGLNEFKGAVILISHDRHLIDATMDRLWLVFDGTVGTYEGDLETYRRDVLKARKKIGDTQATGVETKPLTRVGKKEAAERRKQLAPLRKEIFDKEKEISCLERKLSEIDSHLATSGLFEKAPEEAVTLSKTRAEVERQLSSAEEAWVGLNEKHDLAKAG